MNEFAGAFHHDALANLTRAPGLHRRARRLGRGGVWTAFAAPFFLKRKWT
jgi:hypothetical protein